jgi:hypothetical protein
MTRTRCFLALAASLAVLLTGACSSRGTTNSAGGTTSPAGGTTSPAGGTTTSAGGTTSAAPTTTSAPESNPLGDIPDNQVFVPYRPADGSFTVRLPEGWARTTLPDGATFTDKLNTVTVRELSGRPRPSQDTVVRREMADLASTGRKVTAGPVETVSLPAGPTVHVRFSEDSTPDPVTGRVIRDEAELYVFWRSGTDVLLILSGPHGADNVDPWKTISKSFTWQ